jgi:hypothetical protein
MVWRLLREEPTMASGSSPAAKPSAAARAVLRGLVSPLEWDDEGRPLRLALLTADEGEYEVRLEGAGLLLLDLLREEVLVHGSVVPRPGSPPVVHVSSVRVLPVPRP